MVQRGTGDPPPLRAIWDAPVVLAPCHIISVLIEVLAANPVMDPIFGAAPPTEKALGLIYARAVLADVLSGVVAAARVIGRVQPLPGTRLVGME
jgi:hypothetical protein